MDVERSRRVRFARHFHALASIERADLFREYDDGCRPLNLPEDSATMFAGYVGVNFREGASFLLLAINPGGGGDTYDTRSREDELLYPRMAAFKDSDEHGCVKAFEDVNDTFRDVVMSWKLRKILLPTLDAAGMSIDDIAYMNVVPYRTREDKMPPAAVRRDAWRRVVAPTIEFLAPRALITLGKKAGSVVSTLYQGSLAHYCVPRTRGDSRVSEEAQAMHSRMRDELVNA